MRIIRTTCLGLALCAGLWGCDAPASSPKLPAPSGHGQVVWRFVPGGYKTQDYGYSDYWRYDDGSWDDGDGSTVVLVHDAQPVYVIDDPNSSDGSSSYDSGNGYNSGGGGLPFSIGMVNVTPTQATPGSTVNLGVQITGEDPGYLDFSWTAQGGLMVENKGANVQWVAPSSPGIYSVTVTVTDPQTQQSQSSAVNVQVVAKGGS